MYRRDVLEAGAGVLVLGGLSGCTDGQSSGSDGTEARSTPTETTTSATTTVATTATPTETPVPFPETCEPLPDVDGLLAPPSKLTGGSAESFVREFERAYAVATNDEYGGVESLRVHSVETVGERYVVRLTFDAVPATATPDADGATPTPLPPDAYTHRAVYRLTEERMLRELRSHIDDSLRSRTCWNLEDG
ncbi:MAG: hypothetical protein ABEJ78_07275 [Haloferacaceae archaeon]